jgi:prepilin-type N-terminal cleavage/methylation domain-containing protein
MAAEGGFTLIELMVALVIIAVGVMTLSGIQTRSSRDVHATGRRTNALALAEERIEIARGAGYTNAVSGTGQSGPLTWSTVIDVADVELKRATVTVTWTEGTRADSLQLMTLLALR